MRLRIFCACVCMCFPYNIHSRVLDAALLEPLYIAWCAAASAQATEHIDYMVGYTLTITHTHTPSDPVRVHMREIVYAHRCLVRFFH